MDSSEDKQLEDLGTPEVVSSFKSLMQHPGWVIYEKMFRNDVNNLRKLVISKIDESGEPASEETMDVYRNLIVRLEAVLERPYDIIKAKDSDSIVVQDPFDPYYNTGEKKET